MKGGVIIVEGNIGAGKSTFAQCLAHALDGEYLPEPADGTNPYLNDYYREPARWAFEMQMFLLTRRYRAQRYAQSRVRHLGQGFVVLDRSYHGDVCFARVQLKEGFFSQRDYETYLLHHSDMKSLLEPPAMAIFLDVSACICKRRIDRRMSEKEGRACESGISLDYLDDLQDEIDKLSRSMDGKTVVRHLRWDDDRDDAEIAQVASRIAGELRQMPEGVYDHWTGTDGIGL